MILENLIKPIILSEGITAPLLLKYDNFYAKQLARSDLDADLEGLNSSIEIIQKTRGMAPKNPLFLAILSVAEQKI